MLVPSCASQFSQIEQQSIKCSIDPSSIISYDSRIMLEESSMHPPTGSPGGVENALIINYTLIFLEDLLELPRKQWHVPVNGYISL